MAYSRTQLVNKEIPLVVPQYFTKIYHYLGNSLNMPEISTYKYNKGAVIAYLDKDNVLQTLPTVRHYENGAGDRWTETVDYEYSPGSITFFVTNSDFAKIRPAQMYFKVILLW